MKKKIATKDRPAMAIMMEFPSAFLPILMTAAATTAMTAGFRPENTEAIQLTLP